MTLEFLQLPADERRLYIEQAATRRGVSAVVLEKDFWVCWLLSVLFDSGFADNLVFKGGTSLSDPRRLLMRDMYLSEPPGFDDVVATLADLEASINRPGGA